MALVILSSCAVLLPRVTGMRLLRNERFGPLELSVVEPAPVLAWSPIHMSYN